MSLYDVTKRAMPGVQSVGDSIFYIESAKNPFGRLLKRGERPTQMRHSWPAQIWEDFPFLGVMDGTDKVGGYGHSSTSPLENCAMWMESKGWLVSRIAQNTKRAGVKDEVAKQTADDAFNFARQLERQLLSNAPARVQVGDKPYQNGGAFWWVDPNQPAATEANGYLRVPTAFRPTETMRFTGKLSEFTEAKFETMLRECSEGMNAEVDFTGFVGSALKRSMSLWQKRDTAAVPGTATLAYSLSAKEKKLAEVVDFFEFDSGSVRTITAYNMACDPETGKKTAYSSRSGLFLDMSRWDMVFFEAVKAWSDFTKSGGPRGHHDCIFGSRCTMPFAQPSVWCGED